MPDTYELLTPVNNPSGNPSANDYMEIRHGSISDIGLSDAKPSTDTEVDPDKDYFLSEEDPFDGGRKGDPKEIDDTGRRGGGRAKTAEAQANRNKLLKKALEYIEHHYKPDSFEVTVKAIDIHLLDPTVDTIEIGDVVKVILADGSEKHGTCLKIQYDLMAPENTEYTIGDAEKAIM